ncbi:hypothetical protein [Streptomyces albus]|uniref:Uncharacterized protein n=1 Tax=Streptomyces albus TaxID=1888 RepID=A0A8H1L6E4_9ACTN|nr:hypothetical protein [Streptomyces albus]KPC78312.1 hypothetical protein ADL27_48430 [Streptomyces sp. NRRL F-6602]TGG78478.1 hypothetical protein D8771_25115 [Streptomyces albus]UVN59442.1 hypothetical protein NR995_33435 [Streptomyces albus]
MASVIDPERHADLITLQQRVHALFDELDAYTGEDRQGMRERVRQAAAEKEAALYASGLVEEHGYFLASQDLHKAARAAAQHTSPAAAQD